MKIKIDFVTNSSSASFTILRKHLTYIQEMAIIDHLEIATMLSRQENGPNFGWLGKSDAWSIHVTKDEIHGSTSMDNFDMRCFLEIIGVKEEHIDYEHS